MDAMGLPATIERLDLHLFPRPRILARGVSIGEPDFMAQADWVRLPIQVEPLLKGRINIPEARASQITAKAVGEPAELVERVNAIRYALEQRRVRRRRPSRVTVEQVHLPDINGTLTTMDRSYDIETSVTLHQPQSTMALVEVGLRTPQFGDDAHAAALFALHRLEEGGVALFEGTIELDGVDLRRALDRMDGPHIGARALATVRSTDHGVFASEVQGTIVSLADPTSAETGLEGPVSGSVWLTDHALVINDLCWIPPDGQARADVTFYRDGRTGLAIPDAHIQAAGLDSLLDFLDNESVRLSARNDAHATITDLLIAVEDTDLPRLVSGHGAIQGIDIGLDDNIPLIPNLQAMVGVREGMFIFDELRVEGMEAVGWVRPDLNEGRYEVRLTGQAQLTKEHLSLIGDTPWLQDITGRVIVDDLHALLAEGDNLVESLTVTGVLEQGSGRIETKAFRDTLSELEVAFWTDMETLQLEGTGWSEQFDAVAVEGIYAVQDRRFEGTMAGDVARLDLPLEPDSTALPVVRAALEQYGASETAVTISFTGPEAVEVTLERVGGPPFRMDATFHQTETGWEPVRMDGQTTLPAVVLASVLPDLELRGSAMAHIHRVEHAPHFAAAVDLTEATVRAGDTLHKAGDQPLRINVSGASHAWPWEPESIRVDLLGEVTEGRIAEDRIWMDSLDIDVATWAPLLVDGPEAAGRVRGTLATNPLELDLQIHQLTARLSENLVLESVDGSAAYRDHHWLFDDLVFRGANSDCTLNARMDDGGWRGTLTGTQLDLNTLSDLWDEFQALRPADETESPDPAKRPKGRFDMEVDRVLYRDGTAHDLRAQLTLSTESITIGDIQARAGGGQISGEADIVYPTPELPRTLDVQMNFARVDARFIDAIAFQRSRDVSGRINANLRLSMPLIPDQDPLKGATGTVAAWGKNGSFGRLGIATQLLTVLRSTEIVLLRLPRLRDEGLAYDSFRCHFTFINGVMAVDEFVSMNPSMRLIADGTVDFSRDATDLSIQAAFFGQVTGLMDSVGLGGLAEGVRQIGSITLTASGPPREPYVRVLPTSLFR